jgi:hypothetical protein
LVRIYKEGQIGHLGTRMDRKTAQASNWGVTEKYPSPDTPETILKMKINIILSGAATLPGKHLPYFS